MSQSNYPPGAANDPNAPYNDESRWTEHEPVKKGICKIDGLRCRTEVEGTEADLDENDVCDVCFEPELIEDEEW